MDDFYYHGIWRMDWGFGNPNKTAALIAMLMVGVWAFMGVKRWGFWMALVLFTTLGIALIHTFSRGGIMSLATGLIPVVYYFPPPWALKKTIAVALSILIMVSYSICLNAQGRYEQGITQRDKSIDNRLEIWRCAPQMMVDAPEGWGCGNSGEAYMQWYQPLDRVEKYRTLVNSHLTWLVEFSWPLRFIYVFAWATIFLLCWPFPESRCLSIALGVWIAFAIAAWFSSVAESPWLWILPLTCLLVALVKRLKQKVWPLPIFWTLPILLSCAVMLIVFVLGSGSFPIHARNGNVIIGKGDPQIWIIIDHKVMGNHYGHALRSYLTLSQAENASVGLVQLAWQLPPLANKTVVVAGSAANIAQSKGKLISAKRMIFLNPEFLPQEVGATKEHASHSVIVFGEFSQSSAITAWADYGKPKNLAGVGDFIPDWPELALTL